MIKIGDLVSYHGSKVDRWGVYQYAGPCDCAETPDDHPLCDDRIQSQLANPDGSGERLLHVHHRSYSPLN